MSDTTPKNLANFIWQVADLLRGDYKRADYGKVILPFTVLRRLECVLEPTRDAVLADVADAIERIRGIGRMLSRATDLAAGRLRPLITAAVTGQIDVTTARGVDVS